MNVEERHVVADWVAAENEMPRSIFPEISTEETERPKNRKGVKGPRGEHMEHYGQQVMSVRTPEGFRMQERVAGCRREKNLLCLHLRSSKLRTTCSSGRTRRAS